MCVDGLLGLLDFKNLFSFAITPANHSNALPLMNLYFLMSEISHGL